MRRFLVASFRITIWPYLRRTLVRSHRYAAKRNGLLNALHFTTVKKQKENKTFLITSHFPFKYC